MTQNAVNLAIKYASRSRRLILAQRLSEVAIEKAAELAATQVEEEEEEEEDFRKKLNAGYEIFSCLNFPLLFWILSWSLLRVLYWIVLSSFSYSNTATEWNQPGLRNQVEEEAEDTGEADDIEEKSEIHKHGKVYF